MTVCGAQARGSGGECARPAGWGTDHAGEGRCKLHGGNAGRPPVHGRYSLVHRRSLAEKAQQFLSDPAPGDLTAELALLRALLQDVLDRYGEGVPLDVGAVQAVFGMVQQIASLVERITRILATTALTQAEVQLLQARLADLLVKYVDDPERRLAFLGELGETFEARRVPAGPAGRRPRA